MQEATDEFLAGALGVVRYDRLYLPGGGGALSATGRDYIRAVNMREPTYQSIETLLSQYSALLTPASLGTAPKGLGSTGDPVMNGVWTFLGVPAVTLPLLEADGLPIGVQLIGARRDDGRLLRTARWLARHLAGEV